MDWASRQFEETGLETNSSFRMVIRTYKREPIVLTPIDQKEADLQTWADSHSNIDQEKRLDQYIKDCETMGNEAAKEKYLKNA